MIELSISELKQLPKFKDNIYWSPNGTLYKYSRETKYPLFNREDFFYYVKSLPNINGLLQPQDLLVDEKVYGYEMLPINGLSIEELILKKLINDNKYDIKELMKKLISTLKVINKYFIFSDVRNSNILISESDVTFIDWDIGKKLTDSFMIPPFYIITDRNKIVCESKLTDMIKGFICALSLYYGKSFENLIASKELVDVKMILKEVKANPYIIYYVDYLIEKIKNKDESIELYFDDIIDSIDLPSKKEKERLEKVLS